MESVEQGADRADHAEEACQVGFVEQAAYRADHADHADQAVLADRAGQVLQVLRKQIPSLSPSRLSRWPEEKFSQKILK